MAASETVKKINDLLRYRARGRGASPPTPRPAVGRGKSKERCAAEIEIVWYKWCQDIIQNSFRFQLETRPGQVAAAADPNAKGQEAE